jgi:histidinol-phosphate/aromatic aminotransferase/cobyric acid decarboxylase-like protein
MAKTLKNNGAGFPDAIRVSIGTPEQNEKFVAAIAKAYSA